MRRTIRLAAALPLLVSACGSSPPQSAWPQMSPQPPVLVHHERQTTWIAYQSNVRNGRYGQEGVFLVRERGAHDHEVGTELPGAHLVPSWAPDGRRLVFSADVGDRPRELYVAADDGSQPTRILACTGHCETDDDPAFSPSGAQLAYERVYGPDVDIGGALFPRRFEVRIATLGPHNTRSTRMVVSTRAPVEIDQPRWSPDGTSLVFWEGHYNATGEIDRTAVFLIHADGSGLRQLTPWRLDAGEADWSPDGKHIVFDTHPLRLFGDDTVISNLYTISPSGSQLRRITTATRADGRYTEPKFTPDGRIGFTRVTPIARSIWTIRADGTHLCPVTVIGRVIQTHPEFQP